MTPYQTVGILMTLAACFAYLNHRFIRIHMSIGLMMMSLILSILLIFLQQFGIDVRVTADLLINSVDFRTVLMEGMLGLLLFAGALHVNLNDLHAQKLQIGIYATLGVAASTFLVGTAVYFISNWLGFGLRYLDSLLFGALISPTDPIAVLGILKSMNAPKRLEVKIAGESLFNDGIGVVVFLVILEVATGRHPVSAGFVTALFLQEALGGIAFGLIAGYAAYFLLKSVNNYQVEIMLTLALVMGGYALGSALHISAPLAMVVAGLLIGNRGRQLAMSETTRRRLDTFWELVDEILNALLFVLIGLEVLVLNLRWDYLLAGLIAVPVTLLGRLISVGVPVSVLQRWQKTMPRTIRTMTWGGLRGGISVALALSLPDVCHRELILTMTYAVVAFSIIVQGLTIKRLVRGMAETPAEAPQAS